MVTCDKNVAFLAWDWDSGTLHLQVGELTTKCPGKMVDTVCLRGTPNAITISTKGRWDAWTIEKSLLKKALRPSPLAIRDKR